MRWYRAFLVWVGGTRAGALLVRHVLTRLDRYLYPLTNGRLLATGPAIFPTLLLTTIGRRSGRARTVPLLYLREGERLIVGTAHSGMRRRSGWALNLLAEPRASVRVGQASGAYRARPADPEDAARLWRRLVALYPPYERYAARSGDRKVFLLEPAERHTTA